MKRVLMFIGCAVLAAAALAAQQRPQEIAFQAAVRTETVDRDLKNAIQQYQDIVTKYGDDRPLVARALLRLAECHQKLGNAEAKAIYQRIVKEFADQRAVAASARARLEPAAAVRSVGETVLWSGKDVTDIVAVSPDGSLLAYCDEVTGDVALRTVASGVVRKLTRNEASPSSPWCTSVAFSRDGKQVAYGWLTGGEKRTMQVRLAPIAAGATHQVLLERPPDTYFEIFDTTPDGRVLVQEELSRRNELVLVGTAGTRRVVKTLGLRGATRARVSPSGGHIVFDAPANEQTVQHDVFVMAADGTGETRVTSAPMHESAAGWSPDGRRVLFMVDAGGGTQHLVAQPIDASAGESKAEVLWRNVRGQAFGVTAAGAVYVSEWAGDQAIHTAAVDFSTGKLLGRPNVAVASFWPRGRHPKWSRDGKQFAAIASSRSGGGQIILMVNANDQTRFLPLKLLGVWTYDWSPDGRSFLARASDLDNRHGLYRIDAVTGEATAVRLNHPPAHPEMREWTSAPDRISNFLPHWSVNPGKFYYAKGNPTGDAGGMYERDLVSGEERRLYREKELRTADGQPFNRMRDQTVSPDGRFAAGFSVNPETVLWVVNLADKSVREVFRWNRPHALATNGALVWTPDSKAVVINMNPPGFGTPAYQGYGHELWAISIADGKAVKLDVGMANVRGAAIAIHPDGRQIAFLAGDPGTGEIRVLHNLLSPRPAKRGTQ